MERMNEQHLSLLQRLIALGLGCLSMIAVQAQSLTVIELRHRTAQEVIPVVEPLLRSGDAVTGNDYKLFVRTDAATLKQIRGVVEQLDRKPRQFWVSVRRASRGTIEREAASVSAGVDRRGGQASVLATESERSRDDGAESGVQVMEGSSAFIGTGQSVPMVTVVAGGGRHGWAGVATQHRQLQSGVMVTPRVSGESVTLDIEQQHERSDPNAGGIRTQSVTTQVRGALNEWIALAGVNESSSSTRSGVFDRRYSTSNDSLSVWVKVEER
jgi:hypothetical protein